MSDNENAIEENKVAAECEKGLDGGFFSLYGICNLKRYWLHSFVCFVIEFSYVFLLFQIAGIIPDILLMIFLFVFIILIFVETIHLNCLSVQRLRSIGDSPWKFFIPGYPFVLSMFYPAVSDQSKNKYADSKISHEKLFKILFYFVSVAINGGIVVLQILGQFAEIFHE